MSETTPAASCISRNASSLNERAEATPCRREPCLVASWRTLAHYRDCITAMRTYPLIQLACTLQHTRTLRKFTLSPQGSTSLLDDVQTLLHLREKNIGARMALHLPQYFSFMDINIYIMKGEGRFDCLGKLQYGRRLFQKHTGLSVLAKTHDIHYCISLLVTFYLLQNQP